MSGTNENEVVVITGASAGVGRAVARLFGERKAKTALLARGEAGLEATRRDVVSRGGEALALSTDVSDPAQVEQAAQTVMEKWGRIDIWINCAMLTMYSEFEKITPEEFRRITEVNYLGYVYGTQAALKRMLKVNSGTIVQISSSLAYRSIPLQSAYCGSKHAINGFTDSVRCELLHEDSRVWITAVELPGLNTPQFSWAKSYMPKKPQPVPPIYQPEVAAEAVYWAAHHRRREVTVGGMSLVAIWANKFIPGFLDWYLAKNVYQGQQYDGARDPDRPSNLWEAVDSKEDFGAHGEFDQRSKKESLQFKISKMPGYPFYSAALLTMGAWWLGKKLIRRKT
ncbi:MAG: SDR family oxidoreductase [Chitinispirillaceae bacterium]